MVAFRCYDPSADGSGGIHVWYNGLQPSYQAEIDATLELLALERTLTAVDGVKALRGACEGLTEIIVDFEMDDTEKHIRVLGFDGPGRGGFTLLTGFEKAKDNSIYGFYCRQAHERKEGVMHDGRRAAPCRFP
jgi:hypothetical protein